MRLPVICAIKAPDCDGHQHALLNIAPGPFCKRMPIAGLALRTKARDIDRKNKKKKIIINKEQKQQHRIRRSRGGHQYVSTRYSSSDVWRLEIYVFLRN